MSVEASGRAVAGPSGPRRGGAVEQIDVDFHGAGAGTGEATWGQVRVLRMIQRSGRTMNLAGAMPLPAGTPVEEMVMVLRFVVSRNPALRTRLRFVDDPPGTGRVQQVVAESGHVSLQVHDIGDGDDPAAAAEQARLGYELSAFDHENEYPVRMGVIRQAGAAVQLVVCYSHVMLDGAALDVLIRDLQHLDRSTGEATAPAPAFSPLDLARSQAGAAGIRQDGKALRYWATELGRLSPSWRIAEPDEPQNAPDARFWQLVAYSPAMELGLRAIAVRTGASSTYVLLAAYAVAAGRVLGRDPALAQIVVNNRFRPGLPDAVTQVSQPGICVVDVADTTFDEVVHRAWKAVTSASLHGYYDPGHRDDLLDELASRRARPLDVDWHLNDRRGMAVSGPQPEESAPAGADLKAAMDDALPYTQMFWNHKRPTSDGTLFIHVDSSLQSFIPDDVVLDVDRPAVHLQVWVDTHHFPTARIEAFVREMETVVVEAAFDAAVPTGVRRSPSTVA